LGLFITTYDFILSLARFSLCFLFYLLRSTESLLSLLYEISFPALYKRCLPLVRPGPTRNIYCMQLASENRDFTRSPMPTFDLVVVGSGGGPFETNLSSFVPRHIVLGNSWFTRTMNRYLFKPCDVSWTDGILALEAGEHDHQLPARGRLHTADRRPPAVTQARE